MPEQTFKPNEAVSVDTWIEQVNPNTNNATHVQLRVEFSAAGNNDDTLLKFDLASIPPGSIIEAATLSLYLEDQLGGLGSMLTCHITRILAGNLDWTEGGATWNKKDGVDDWAGSAGCETRGVDIAGADLWSGEPTVNVGAYNVFELDPTDFQALLDTGNYGFKYWSGLRDGDIQRFVRYASASDADANQHPKLWVRWREPSKRLVRYTIDVWDLDETILDNQGQTVTPDRVQANELIRLIGAGLPTSETYADKLADPHVSYIEGVSYRMDSNKAHIKASKESMIQAFLKRLGGMTS